MFKQALQSLITYLSLSLIIVIILRVFLLISLLLTYYNRFNSIQFNSMLRFNNNHHNNHNHRSSINNNDLSPISRTIQYKKVTKPLLERKRRARINRCLEQLKDLMADALETEGEQINKLEKADILELTVKHLQRITKSQYPMDDIHRFQAGFSQCASEACNFLLSLPGMDVQVGKKFVDHLRKCVLNSSCDQFNNNNNNHNHRHNNNNNNCTSSSNHEYNNQPSDSVIVWRPW